MLSFSPSADDYDDSPPSPPRTLEDQVYVAYAHDDIHRAKILLLKLKGIEVTSDNDPRIAAVQDEDFDFCFIPNGKLISEEEEKAMIEAHWREQKRRQREERLRACEYIWEHAKRRMREERIWLQRRRDLEERRRAAAAEEAERQRALLELRDVAVARLVPRVGQRRNVVSYDTLARSASQPSRGEPFVYDVMVHPSSARSARSTPSSSPRCSQLSTPSSSPPKHSHSHSTISMRPAAEDCRSVSFKDVAASLDGPLFPLTTEERQHRVSISDRGKPRSRSRDHQRQKQAELLDSLLSVVEWDGAERRLRKGKAKEVELQTPCGQCSIQLPPLSTSASSSSISSCPSLTRSNSWLSFVSRSPDSFSPPIPPLIPSWLKRARCTTCCTARKRHLQRVPIPTSEAPLHLNNGTTKVELILKRREKRSTSPRREHLTGAANVVAQSFGHLLEAAKQFQRAYMMVAVYNAAELNNSTRSENDYNYWNKKRAMMPTGTRAQSKTVQAFLAGISLSSEKATQYIPLVSPFPPKHPPRTVLPNPLPYPVVFKPHPPVSRSPFRLQQQQKAGQKSTCRAVDRLLSETCGEINLRIRHVGNPAYLRLRALHNIIYERGFNWEGRGRDCGFSSGKETLPSIAIDGLGRSLLSVC